MAKVKAPEVKIQKMEDVKGPAIVIARTSDAVPTLDDEALSKAKVKRDGIVRFLRLVKGWKSLTVTTAGNVKARREGTKVAVVPMADLGRVAGKAAKADVTVPVWLGMAQANGTLNGVSTGESVRLWIKQHTEGDFGGLAPVYVGFVPAE